MELLYKLVGKSGREWDRPRVALVALLLVITALTLLKVYLTEELDTDNFVYARQLSQLRDLDSQNQELLDRLLQAESLTVIATRAAALGFVPESFIYVQPIYGGR